MGMKDETCQVKVEIDEEGVPSAAEARKCPEVFKEAAVAGAMKSRFYPYIADGKAMKVSFVWTFRFVAR
ncbi:MAG TPA: energy transducer TonB, partial [Myxococcota bacterium]|nr:energy transducer TonB [Myxococcota bacterium]